MDHTDPLVVDLSDPRACDAALAGAKAANLARAASAGLPVPPGVVLTTAGEGRTTAIEAVVAEWVARGRPTVAVRSSSTVEDASASSMAGQFATVLGVADEAALVDALHRVTASGARPRSGEAERPIAVLVQAEIAAACGGVAFGLDPITGDRRVCAVDAVAGSPEPVVSGSVVASHLVLDRRGRVRSSIGPRLDDLLPAARRRQLVRLTRRVATVFGSVQDVEWAFDGDGRLWLLQSRPVTAVAAVPHGPVYGPGPLAETFPDPLAPLEADLWIEPLREALIAALDSIGLAPHRHPAPAVVVVGGRVAIDLELIGAAPRSHTRLRALSPVRGVRHLLASWRTGRLRGALPALAGDLVAAVDRELLEHTSLDGLDGRELLEVLDATRVDLRALHGYEILCGMLLRGSGGATAAGAALYALGLERRVDGDDELVAARRPIVLALTAPCVGGRASLPRVAPMPGGAGIADLGPREALRLRCRWVQELGARAAEQLGGRLHDAGALGDPRSVRRYRLDDLAALARGMAVDAPDEPVVGPPLPTMFRLRAGDVPVASAGSAGAGIAASAGRAEGRVRARSAPPSADGAEVLVVPALTPDLAAELPRVVAVVSETGSPLSHLAILAREQAVPVAVGVQDAVRRFPPGTRVLVDGGTGDVVVLDTAVEP